jgi:hypothetical protein
MKWAENDFTLDSIIVNGYLIKPYFDTDNTYFEKILVIMLVTVNIFCIKTLCMESNMSQKVLVDLAVQQEEL